MDTDRSWGLPMIPVVPPSSDTPTLILGVTHLLLPDGKAIRLLKCPFCNFRNIHEDEIDNHIQFTKDVNHDVDLRLLAKWRYFISSTSQYGPYLGKEAISLPRIRCLFCNYHDKIEWDLSVHFLEEHKKDLLAIPITRREHIATKNLLKNPQARPFAKFESPMEYRLDKAVKIAQERSESGGGE